MAEASGRGWNRRTALLAGVSAGLAVASGAAGREGRVAQAQEPPGALTRGSVSMAQAQLLLAAAEARAREIGINVTAVVVDESGVLKALQRMDGASLGSVDLAMATAHTAVAFRTPTNVLADRVRADPAALASFANATRVVLLPGGFPIGRGANVIGGLGVSGGTGEQDMEIAQAALALFS